MRKSDNKKQKNYIITNKWEKNERKKKKNKNKTKEYITKDWKTANDREINIGVGLAFDDLMINLWIS